MNYQDVSVKLCYEWVKTGNWNHYDFKQWLKAKDLYETINTPVYTKGGTLIHRPNCQLCYEWVKTGHYNLTKFKNILNMCL